MKNPKLFLFGLAAVLAGSLVLAGREGSAGADGGAGGHGNNGASAPVVLSGEPTGIVLQSLIDTAVQAKSPVYVAVLTIPAASIIDFKDAGITFFGASKFAAAANKAVVNFSTATIEWKTGATFDMKPATVSNTAVTILSLT